MGVKSVTTYALPHALVRALYATILPTATWQDLVQAQDMDAILAILSKTAYQPYLEIERELLTPRRVVYQTRCRLADLYDKIIDVVAEPGRQLLLWLWRLYEVDNIKAVLRGVEAGASWKEVLYLLSPMARHATLTKDSLEKMVQTEDVTRAVELTSDTPYYDTLAHALERYQAEKSLFPLEVALDLEYSRRLWQSVDQLAGLDHEQALRIVGSILDKDNLLWAIRYRVYHNLSEQEIINYTLPFGYQVHDEDIRAIATGSNITQVVKRIYPDLEGVEAISEDGTGLEKLERALQHRVVQLCHAAFLGYPFHIGIPIAYLILNEYEIEGLTVLVEAKTSHLPLDIFAPMLVVHTATPS
ncbi:MAG: hypothetical protein DRI48_03280 [Chloroflexi bacterium]|nr:MAG: hypothetical protein DRI48_03280 [Chloroflexota bacterium]